MRHAGQAAVRDEPRHSRKLDVVFNGAVGNVHATLQHAARELTNDPKVLDALRSTQKSG
jgi:hypothetical protein